MMKSTLFLVAAFAVAVTVVVGFIHDDLTKLAQESELPHEEVEHHHHHHHHHHGHHGHHGHHHHRHHHHHHRHHHHHHHCRGQNYTHSAELSKAGHECHSEFKHAKENNVTDRHHGITCFAQCIGKKVQFFDQNGQVNQTKMNQLIDSIIPNAEARVEIKQKSVECAKNATTTLKGGPSDRTCSNYKPYLRCVFFSAVKACRKPHEYATTASPLH